MTPPSWHHLAIFFSLEVSHQVQVTLQGRVIEREGASLVAQMVKNLPAMWEMWVRSLGQEDPLEKEMATHSSILTRIIPWTEEPGRLQAMGSQRVRHNWASNTFRFVCFFLEGEACQKMCRHSYMDYNHGFVHVSPSQWVYPDYII